MADTVTVPLLSDVHDDIAVDVVPNDAPKPNVPVSEITVGVVKEPNPAEKRVALVPSSVAKLVKKGFKVVVASGAGLASGFSDAMYTDAGASVVFNKDAISADIVFRISVPDSDIPQMKNNGTLFSLIQPRQNGTTVQRLADKNMTVFGLDCVPRTISRAQAFDVLSSQANISGYRAVIEAAAIFQRFFSAQFTMAGRVDAAKVLVIGAGVAGLAAIQTAKNMGAIVRAFDVRAAAREQVESFGAEFLEVKIQESGEGGGGYAKEMSPEFIAAEMELFMKQCKEVDIVITTALIPGRPAPKLISKEMVEAMKPGSITVDLAAESGGNVATTQAGKSITTPNGVHCIGYTDLPSRCADQASTMFSNNVTAFLLSMVNKENNFAIDHSDEAVRGALVLQDGAMMWPPPPKPQAEAPAQSQQELSLAEPPAPPPAWRKVFDGSLSLTVLLLVGLAMGFGLGHTSSGGYGLATLMMIFILACLIGWRVVWGVIPALHSPLMSVTNAISGMTAVGGLMMLDGDWIPASPVGWVAAFSVFISCINIFGGFLMTGRMLNMFRRPGDPPSYTWIYGMPLLASAGGYVGLLYVDALQNSPGLQGIMALLSGLCCISAIGGLSTQDTCRKGNALGVIGVALGVLSTIGGLSPTGPRLVQMVALIVAGGSLGTGVAASLAITDLPQLVAAFHSLVGLAAACTSVISFAAAGPEERDDYVHKVSVWAGTFIGAITFTGSIIAFGKLQGLISSKEVFIPGRHYINSLVFASSIAATYWFVPAGTELFQGLIALGVVAAGAMFLGVHMTTAIGGADMPVVITVLNSYSGWALCAEGFVLTSPVLTIVGALIGSSGAILSIIMCRAMNRYLHATILGVKGTISQANGAVARRDVEAPQGEATTKNVEEIAEMLVHAKKIVLVPGYGVAVAKAQYAIASMIEYLRNKGKDFRVGIHPVAGRMPGQLNVLMAEAGVPYDIVFELEEINPELDSCDVAIVCGANDTVNPAAEEDPTSELAGMPVIQVWHADQVVVMKRSLRPGYAGVENPLFVRDNTDMFLGDAKVMSEKLFAALQEKME